ncbi:DUF2690 domain-containing protein [Streptomyces sp. NPDC047028]|uniref:helix-turn-helix domain-containing protein n=1 Tax=Streptomyces sp. NPDC047028 TaxID=3155793 RepID=UPI0033D7C365
MPKWNALPDELDPQIKEFIGQLRRLVDRSGLGVAALADRTGYAKTSWERYLGGRLLAPEGAVVALAEVTGVHPAHLTTFWELAERAWHRTETRHDRTMEANRVSEARAALEEPGDRDRTGDGKDAGSGGGAAGNSWRMAGYRGPSPSGAPPAPSSSPSRASGASGAAVPDGPGWTQASVPGPYGPPPEDRRPGDEGAVGGGGSGGAGRQRLTMFLAGVVGVLVVIGAVFFFTRAGGGANGKDTAASTSPSPSSRPDLPAGVKCAGSACTGKDAEAMGCSGDLVTTVKSVAVGTTILEVRYSKTCGAAWARITGAAQGDQVRVLTGGKTRQSGAISAPGDTIAYTPMVAVGSAARAKACATLASGRTGCTT